jgi:hypothetical protein
MIPGMHLPTRLQPIPHPDAACWLVAMACCMAVVLSSCASIPKQAAIPASRQPTPTLDPALPGPIPAGPLDWAGPRIAGPGLPAKATQADKGALVYWQICMACHGDQGQGLTLEWRQAWGVKEQNCWQSRCHAANHPPQGFTFPHTVPAVMGAASLARYETGRDLYDHISQSMPWWSPGSLTQPQALAVTAFLLREKGVLPKGVTLDSGTLPIVDLARPALETAPQKPLVAALTGAVILAALALGGRLLWPWRAKRRK